MKWPLVIFKKFIYFRLEALDALLPIDDMTP